MPATTRILIVDDNTLMRQGLRSLLSEHFTVVGEACDGKSAIAEAWQLQPDVVVMDLALPGMNGIDVTAHIKRRLPEVRTVMLMALKSLEYMRDSLRIGVHGYLLKNASYEELLTAIRAVVQGKIYLSPDVSSHLLAGFLDPRQKEDVSSPLKRLTPRERSILQLIAEGRSNRTAAEFLSLSPKTVEKHRSRLMHKLGLRNAAELTLVALELGLIERPGSVSRLVDDAAPA